MNKKKVHKKKKVKKVGNSIEAEEQEEKEEKRNKRAVGNEKGTTTYRKWKKYSFTSSLLWDLFAAIMLS